MAEMLLEGKTLQEIGDIFGVTRERVRQILSKVGIDPSEVRECFNSEIREKKKEALEEKRRKRKTVSERFMDKVQKTTEGHWLWIGATNKVTGYGHFGTGGKGNYSSAHRFSYSFFNKREIPEGLEIDHICRIKACVNPEHLEAVTHRENVLRGNVPHTAKENVKKAHAAIRNRTHCKRGHEQIPENMFVATYNGQLRRNCRLCMNMRGKRNRGRG